MILPDVNIPVSFSNPSQVDVFGGVNSALTIG
jgi:hypothetical protein